MITIRKTISSFFLEKFSAIDKSRRIIISTMLMSLLMLVSTFFFFDKAVVFIPIFIVFIYFLTYFSLLEGIEKIEWLMLFLIPVSFTVVCYVFYFLFPVRWLSRLPFILFYTVSIYAILRTSNIFNVGVEKSLQLYRAAFSVNYFFQTALVFLFTNFLFSLKLNFLLNASIILIFVFFLALNLFWSIKLDMALERQVVKYGMLLAVILAQGAVLLSFSSFEVPITALILTASYYSLAGLAYAHLDQRFFKETIREYIFVLIFVFAIALVTSIR